MADQDLFIAWLKDAHAMENGIIQALGNQVPLAADHPMIQQGIERHLEATRRHAEILEGCLQELGETPSGVKEALGTVGGKVSAVMGGAKDDLVKAAMDDYATEHMEIASYQALIAAAPQLGHTGMVAKFEEILAEEQAMAAWLAENLPTLAREAVIVGKT
jgi:ferritin-like metal-binding protein YciE